METKSLLSGGYFHIGDSVEVNGEVAKITALKQTLKSSGTPIFLNAVLVDPLYMKRHHGLTFTQMVSIEFDSQPPYTFEVL
jgi:hypothetical protein